MFGERKAKGRTIGQDHPPVPDLQSLLKKAGWRTCEDSQRSGARRRRRREEAFPRRERPSLAICLLPRNRGQGVLGACRTRKSRGLKRKVPTSQPRPSSLIERPIPGSHSITSSATARSCGGTATPSTAAVLRFRTSSILVGCITGRSAGLSPLTIRPT